MPQRALETSNELKRDTAQRQYKLEGPFSRSGQPIQAIQPRFGPDLGSKSNRNKEVALSVIYGNSKPTRIVICKKRTLAQAFQQKDQCPRIPVLCKTGGRA